MHLFNFHNPLSSFYNPTLARALAPLSLSSSLVGLASLTNGVGVVSFARYDDSFNEPPLHLDSIANYDRVTVTDRLLWRACKVRCGDKRMVSGLREEREESGDLGERGEGTWEREGC